MSRLNTGYPTGSFSSYPSAALQSQGAMQQKSSQAATLNGVQRSSTPSRSHIPATTTHIPQPSNAHSMQNVPGLSSHQIQQLAQMNLLMPNMSMQSSGGGGQTVRGNTSNVLNQQAAQWAQSIHHMQGVHIRNMYNTNDSSAHVRNNSVPKQFGSQGMISSTQQGLNSMAVQSIFNQQAGRSMSEGPRAESKVGAPGGGTVASAVLTAMMSSLQRYPTRGGGQAPAFGSQTGWKDYLHSCFPQYTQSEVKWVFNTVPDKQKVENVLMNPEALWGSAQVYRVTTSAPFAVNGDEVRRWTGFFKPISVPSGQKVCFVLPSFCDEAGRQWVLVKRVDGASGWLPIDCVSPEGGREGRKKLGMGALKGKRSGGGLNLLGPGGFSDSLFDTQSVRSGKFGGMGGVFPRLPEQPVPLKMSCLGSSPLPPDRRSPPPVTPDFLKRLFDDKGGEIEQVAMEASRNEAKRNVKRVTFKDIKKTRGNVRSPPPSPALVKKFRNISEKAKKSEKALPASKSKDASQNFAPSPRKFLAEHMARSEEEEMGGGGWSDWGSGEELGFAIIVGPEAFAEEKTMDGQKRGVSTLTHKLSEEVKGGQAKKLKPSPIKPKSGATMSLESIQKCDKAEYMASKLDPHSKGDSPSHASVHSDVPSDASVKPLLPPHTSSNPSPGMFGKAQFSLISAPVTEEDHQIMDHLDKLRGLDEDEVELMTVSPEPEPYSPEELVGGPTAFPDPASLLREEQETGMNLKWEKALMKADSMSPASGSRCGPVNFNLEKRAPQPPMGEPGEEEEEWYVKWKGEEPADRSSILDLLVPVDGMYFDFMTPEEEQRIKEESAMNAMTLAVCDEMNWTNSGRKRRREEEDEDEEEEEEGRRRLKADDDPDVKKIRQMLARTLIQEEQSRNVKPKKKVPAVEKKVVRLSERGEGREGKVERVENVKEPVYQRTGGSEPSGYVYSRNTSPAPKEKKEHKVECDFQCTKELLKSPTHSSPPPPPPKTKPDELLSKSKKRGREEVEKEGGKEEDEDQMSDGFVTVKEEDSPVDRKRIKICTASTTCGETRGGGLKRR